MEKETIERNNMVKRNCIKNKQNKFYRKKKKLFERRERREKEERSQRKQESNFA